jgi:hypothetical protein
MGQVQEVLDHDPLAISMSTGHALLEEFYVPT